MMHLLVFEVRGIPLIVVPGTKDRRRWHWQRRRWVTDVVEAEIGVEVGVGVGVGVKEFPVGEL